MPIPQEADPLALFASWYDEASRCTSIEDHTTAALATADADGTPDLRMVLLKGFDAAGFVFYTNLHSPKAQQLSANPSAALCFHWAPLEKQIRIRGPVAAVSETEADAYFASRPLQSQIGAWASKQSQPLEGILELERRVAYFTAKFSLGRVPRPSFWSGFRLTPRTIEFWLKKPYRLHERLRYTTTPDGWKREHLFP